MGGTFYAEPAAFQTGDSSVELTGLFMYRDEPAGEASVRAFLGDFGQGTADFEDCTGAYRFHAVYPDGRELRFGDNAGIMRWYIREGNCPPDMDKHLSCGHAQFHTSLAEAVPEDRTPDYAAIAQFLYFGCIYGTETIFRAVRRTDPGKYYVMENGRLTEKDKNLKSLEELEPHGDALEEQMARFAKAVDGCGGIACTITGGTDSRNILSHMLHEGMRPLLDITGADTDGDVRIAREIAGRLGMELLWTSDVMEGEGWIDEAVRAADGMAGVCGIYRLNKKARTLKEKGVLLECGGLAGEFYKNDFISFDYPFYGGKPNWNRFLYHIVMSYDFPSGLCGEAVLPAMNSLPERLTPWLASHSGSSKHSAYLSAGREIMQGRAAAVCAMNSRYYIQYTPLMERRVAAMLCRKNPYSLENHAYPRERVSSLCPEIKDIRSVTGMTFDPHVTLRESMSYKKTILRSRLALSVRRNKVRGRRDDCFQAGLSSPQFYAALERCKALGILAPEVDGDALPAPIADRAFALGSML